MPKVAFLQIGGSNDYIVGGAINFVNQIDIRTAAAIIKYCDALVTGDSYASHAASAVETRAVVLFGASDPKAFGHEEHINLIHRETVSISSQNNKFAIPDFDLADITRPIPWEGPHRQRLQKLTVGTVIDSLKYLLRTKFETCQAVSIELKSLIRKV